ncbi:MAG: DUF4291 domain-containing protein [Planctomycetota bacterium]
MQLLTEPYLAQRARWPAEGRVVLAQADATSVIVYQAYRPAVGHFAAQHGWFGGEFSLNRMTWIKPNFLWMMYRSSWGTAHNQEVVLAVRMRREAFDHVLATAVHSQFDAERYDSQEHWQKRVAGSDVRLQWDPDHAPGGAPQARRAVQLGMRGAAARSYSRDWLLGIEDISPFVAEQRAHVAAGALDRLVTPREEPYPIAAETARHLGID